MLELDQWDAVSSRLTGTIYRGTERSLPMPCSTCWRLDLIQSSGRRWQNEIHEAGRRPHVFLELLAPAQASDAAVARINPPDSAGAVACPALGRSQSRRPRIPVPCPAYSAGHGHRKASCHRKQPAGGPRMPGETTRHVKLLIRFVEVLRIRRPASPADQESRPCFVSFCLLRHRDLQRLSSERESCFNLAPYQGGRWASRCR